MLNLLKNLNDFMVVRLFSSMGRMEKVVVFIIIFFVRVHAICNKINDQYCDMLITYSMSNENSAAAKGLYLQRFPGRTNPDATVFLRLMH